MDQSRNTMQLIRLFSHPIGEPLARACLCSQGLPRPVRQAGSQIGWPLEELSTPPQVGL